MKENLKKFEEVVFVIDMNNGFCNEGNLADPSIKRIVPDIINIIEYYKKRGAIIANVNDMHDKDSVELLRYADHCCGDEESNTIDELKECLDGAYNFYKNSTSALFAPGVMDLLLDMTNLRKVVIVGCCTDICIQNFAVPLRCFLDQFNRTADIVIYENAVDTYNIPGSHERDKVNKLAFLEMQRNGIKLERKLR